MRKFQKSLAVILSVLMLTLLFAVGAGATSTSAITLSANKQGVAVGETFTVSVNVTGDPSGVQAKLSFEKDKVEFVSAAINESLKPTNTLSNSYIVKEDYVEFMLLSADATVEGAWITFTFKAKTSAVTTSAGFSLDDAVAVIGEAKETPAVTNLSVGITPSAQTGTLGDLNGDGEVDLLDLVRMKKDLAITAPATTVNDVNKDSLFNADDATLMIQYILGTITSF